MYVSLSPGRKPTSPVVFRKSGLNRTLGMKGGPWVRSVIECNTSPSVVYMPLQAHEMVLSGTQIFFLTVKQFS